MDTCSPPWTSAPLMGERGSLWPEQEKPSHEWHFMPVALPTGENGLKNPTQTREQNPAGKMRGAGSDAREANFRGT